MSTGAINMTSPQQPRGTLGVHPQKFALWLGMASMTMFFAALTSALIVKKANFTAWESFKIPEQFLYSTIIVVFISLFLHVSYLFYKQSKFAYYRLFLFLTVTSAIAFLLMQYSGWQALQEIGVFVDGNASGSFIYFISGAHALHIIGGLVFLIITFAVALKNRKNPIFELNDIVNPKRKLNLELLLTYWHYIDFVWIYLFIFFKVNYL